ncbi:AfsR/SARP family transcriptional regulator [Catellatospora citrea]|uniref:AfsR/SARP family transcriptional regulator n=1 Tax=Catellatospora citrea TaxID=53366 RepID=UPI003400D9FB
MSHTGVRTRGTVFDYRLLGVVELGAVPEPGAQSALTRALLTALLLEESRFVSHDKLIRAMWERPPASAVANMRTYVNRLRCWLALSGLGDRLQTRRRDGGGGGGYRLPVETARCDVLAFRLAAEEGGAALRANDVRSAANVLHQAMEIWPPSAQLSVTAPADSWLGTRLADLDEARLQAAENLRAARLMLGDAPLLMWELRGHVAAHPHRERAWGQLMQGLYLARDPAAALDTFHSARHCFDRDLGVELSPNLHRLYRAILRHDEPAVITW